MPKLSHSIEVENPNTGVKNTVVLEGLADFFRLSIAREDLESYYKINFALMQYHKYSLTEIENMMPWEREIYLALLKDHIETENLKRQQREGKLNNLKYLLPNYLTELTRLIKHLRLL